MNLELTGKLLVKNDTQVISDRFKKREFVLEIVDETPNGNFTNYAKMQLVQNKTDLLDRFREGENLRATFNIRGSKYEKNGMTNYITNLEVWRLEPAESGNSGGNQNSGYENAAPSGGYNSGGGNNYSNNSNSGNSSFSASPAQEADDLPF